MTTYRTSDGKLLAGSTSREVIKALRAGSHHPESSLELFMEAMAARAAQQTGRRVPTGSQAQFVAGLVEAGLLIREE